MSEIPEDAKKCRTCGALATVKLHSKVDESFREDRCDLHDGGRTAQGLRVDLAQAWSVRVASIGGAMAVVHATARVRASGRFTSAETRDAWRELMGVADAIVWCAKAEYVATGRLPDLMPDADAASEVSRMLAKVRIPRPRGRLLGDILEFADAAVRSLGGIVAVEPE